MLLGLKVDVFSREAARQLPQLLHLLAEYKVQATLFPALGRASAPGFVGRWLRRVPELGREAREILLAAEQTGHELGAVAYDLKQWRRHVMQRDGAWTHKQLRKGIAAFHALFDYQPSVIAAVDFLINADTLNVEATLGFEYAVDSRGLSPYLPLTQAGLGTCPQLPVTLPSIEEVLRAGEPLEEVHQFIFMECQKPLLPGHVFNFTLGHAEHLPVLEKLIVMWMGSKRDIVPLRHLMSAVAGPLPTHQVGMLLGNEGGAGHAVQGKRIEHA